MLKDWLTRHSPESGNPVELFNNWMPAPRLRGGRLCAGMTIAELLRRVAGGVSLGWRVLRRMSGDDAYERYLAHWRAAHHGDGPPLTRKAFYRAEQARKWDGIRRCC